MASRKHAQPAADAGGKDGDPEPQLADAGLQYVSDADPGIVRRRAGRGFSYRRPDGTQYRYHADWQRLRCEARFARLPAFARALPRLRRRLRRDLGRRGLPRDKVLAIVVSLLMDTLVRIGNDAYARDNRSYGLTTLRDRHLQRLRGGRARLRFRGKGGQAHEVAIDDPRLARLVRACQELPGQQLFQYRDAAGRVRPLDSADVNAYLRRAMGGDFTAKDFRTWGGTLHAFRRLAETPLPEAGARGGGPGERALARIRNQVVGEVASALRNTPAVCRRAYIDPLVFHGWEDGSLAVAAAPARGARQWEQAAWRFLRRAASCQRRLPAR